jgi:hypothetical protein
MTQAPNPTPTKKTPTKLQASLDKIQYADDAPAAPDPNKAGPGSTLDEVQRTVAVDKANQDAAKKAIAAMKHMDPNKPAPAPKLPQVTPEEAVKLMPKLYRVLETAKIARGGTTTTLPAGKTFSQNEYDIAALMRAGVKLEEVPV